MPLVIYGLGGGHTHTHTHTHTHKHTHFGGMKVISRNQARAGRAGLKRKNVIPVAGDFLQEVSTGSRSQPDADELFIFDMSPCSVWVTPNYI